jgi:hypothetical protein
MALSRQIIVFGKNPIQGIRTCWAGVQVDETLLSQPGLHGCGQKCYGLGNRPDTQLGFGVVEMERRGPAGDAQYTADFPG